MNEQLVTQERDAIEDIQKLCSMTEKLEGRLKVMKETYEQAMPIQYENGYIQGFKDRYEGIQSRYKDIHEKSNQWYDYHTMETHRLHQLNFQKFTEDIEHIQEENQRLKDENKETIKSFQIERDEFQRALRKAQDDMMTLRARSRDIQYDSRRTADEMIDLKKIFHKFSCNLQEEIHLLKEENSGLKDENSDLQEENQILKDENSHLEQENQRLQEIRDNEKTIKEIQVDRGDFQYALVKARDEIMELRREDKEEIMNLRTRNIENQEKMKRLEANISQFQSSLVKAENLQTDIYYNSKV